MLLRLTPVLEAIALELRESPPEAPSPSPSPARGEGIGGRCGAGAAARRHILMRHDLYHAGEINHLRALAQDNDAWAW